MEILHSFSDRPSQGKLRNSFLRKRISGAVLGFLMIGNVQGASVNWGDIKIPSVVDQSVRYQNNPPSGILNQPSGILNQPSGILNQNSSNYRNTGTIQQIGPNAIACMIIIDGVCQNR